MDFSSFLTSLGTSFVIFVVLMLFFTWLSRKPGNQVVYFPSRILRGLEPWEGARRSRSPVAWIREAFAATEADIVASAGVDAAVYLIFLSSVLGIFVLSGLLLLPVLLPIAVTDHAYKSLLETNSNSTFNNLDKLAMGNVHAKSSRLWAFLLANYWVSFVTFYVLWKSYKHVSDLRAATRSSQAVRPEDYAVLVRDIPADLQGQSRKEQVDSYFRALHPDTFYKSMVVTDNKQANKIWEELEGYKKKLARADVVFAESKTTSNPEGTRPNNKTGFLGLIGEKVDTINYCNEKINELAAKLEIEQKETLKDKQQAAALVFFTSRAAAVSASQTLHAQMVDTWTVTEAPEPRQLIWKNLTKKFFERQIWQYVVYGIVFLTVVFYMIPIAAISAFTTLQNLRKYLPFLKVIINQKAVKTILEAYLPQLALIIFLALLPALLLFLSKAEGIPSQGHVIRAASGKYFYFIVFNVFLGVTIGGTLFASLKIITKTPKKIVNLLADSLPPNATFFVTYVALQFFVGYGLELSRLVPLIIFHLKKKYLCKTEAEVKEAWAPGDFGYATRVPSNMLIMMVVFCYSVISPIIIPFGAVYFGLGWLIARNQALNVYVPSYESYGRMWPHIHSRIVASLIIFQVLMFGYLGLKKFYYAPLMIPLIILSFIFAYTCNKRFYQSFFNTPLETAYKDTKETPNLDSVYAAYIPPCLKPEKPDDVVENYEDEKTNVSRTSSV
ncbi:CSC1-like protein ERD4 [Dendrobium catenatum]|uniref:DNA-directed RNA polymerase III subunit RPC2 n=1 Tax=Dendrobium catenatum TaxID=906689 RepID=A0A2I0W106_9ASPA|nr:CSC1-like protein ERD4 [Dendrobium catenatum]PKU69353.1 DNA-directed RNA polymerase III subunit RPC2 [Dendrobium catenatum]